LLILIIRYCDQRRHSLIEVTHAQKTCIRNLHRIELRNLHRIERSSIRCKFLVQVSSTSFSSVCHLYEVVFEECPLPAGTFFFSFFHFIFIFIFFHIGTAFVLYAHLYVHITTYLPTYFVAVIHLLCYVMLCAFVTYSIKLLLLLQVLVPAASHNHGDVVINIVVGPRSSGLVGAHQHQ